LQKDKYERDARFEKTNIGLLEYSSTVSLQRLTTPQALSWALERGRSHGGDVRLRLFVVEDLSRDVIENLGSHFDIEPDFFREHIVDYAWYNVRDPWRNPPNLKIVSRQQHWFQVRYVTSRYFDTPDSFKRGFEESQTFNVLRRPDDDQNNKAFWDKKEAIVGMTRSRASFWLKQADGPNNPAVGKEANTATQSLSL